MEEQTNIMTKRKSTKRQSMVHNILHRKLRLNQRGCNNSKSDKNLPQNPGVIESAPLGLYYHAQLMVFVGKLSVIMNAMNV